MKRLLIVTACFGLAACGSSPTAPSASAPLFMAAGNGNAVVTVSSSVSHVRITGTYTGTTSNFIVWQGPSNVPCDSTISLSCALLVNDLIGTIYGRTVSDGTYVTNGQGTFQIVDSPAVTWTIQEVR